MNTSPDLTHWQCLIEHYFDAQTTEGEEAQLRAFVTSARADTEEFASLRAELDEVRAVMGFAARAKRAQRAALSSPKHKVEKPAHSHRSRLWPTAAAVLLVGTLVGGGALVYDYRHPDCVAYVEGVRITDPIRVQQEMERTLQGALAPTTDAPTVESQLHDMVSTLEENQNIH